MSSSSKHLNALIDLAIFTPSTMALIGAPTDCQRLVQLRHFINFVYRINRPIIDVFSFPLSFSAPVECVLCN